MAAHKLLWTRQSCYIGIHPAVTSNDCISGKDAYKATANACSVVRSRYDTQQLHNSKTLSQATSVTSRQTVFQGFEDNNHAAYRHLRRSLGRASLILFHTRKPSQTAFSTTPYEKPTNTINTENPTPPRQGQCPNNQVTYKQDKQTYCCPGKVSGEGDSRGLLLRRRRRCQRVEHNVPNLQLNDTLDRVESQQPGSGCCYESFVCEFDQEWWGAGSDTSCFVDVESCCCRCWG